MRRTKRIRSLRLVSTPARLRLNYSPQGNGKGTKSPVILTTLPTPLIEREVKRANRDLVQSISKMDNMQKIDYLTKRSSELLADMRRLEKDNQKNKRSRDNLQKERDGNRTELSKTVGLKEKLEKLCRELQRDNNKMKVSTLSSLHADRWRDVTERAE